MPLSAAKAAKIRPYIVGIGGTLRPNSTTEVAIRITLAAAKEAGATIRQLSGAALDLPTYGPHLSDRTPAAQLLIEELRRADGIILGSPGYHGGISGMVKNALDYTEDMRADESPYFEGRAIGCIATGAGWQGAMTTLAALRDVTHALRGWPTPLGVPLNTLDPIFDAEGQCLSPRTHELLSTMAQQVVAFASQHRR